MKRYKVIYIFILALTVLVACGNSTNTANQPEEVDTDIKAPEFNGDSAFAYVKAQCDFGPRVPNSTAHTQCGDWLVAKFKEFGATVTEQKATLRGWDGTALNMRNIVASYKPEARKRVIICSHWDSRPWADNDPDEKNHHTPIDGADDGASGVGIMVELARQLQLQETEVGIDLICFDLEDYGTPQWYNGKHDENSWCLGSQYWAHSPHTEGYNARFGILLDMVGNANARFYKEYFSQKMASGIVSKVWKKAHKLGVGAYFPKSEGGAITDDHLPINNVARIPCIDIIPQYPTCEQSSFGPIWHTVNDNISNIDKSTLKVVGQVLMEVIYNEK
ncbi:MAG: M28 family peptidase [Bacteroidales bacterium]|nr:M28 family peptidase [Bacteroidales bacterium]